jgi:hypothetical protein
LEKPRQKIRKSQTRMRKQKEETNSTKNAEKIANKNEGKKKRTR